MKNTRILLCTLLIMIGMSGATHADSLLYGSDTVGNLYTISTTDASSTLIGNTGWSLSSLEFAPDGKLYALTPTSTARLLEIDPVTANATVIGYLTNDHDNDFYYEGGLAFGSDGTAYGTNKSGGRYPLFPPTLFSVDLSTGFATDIGSITDAYHDFNGLAWRSDGMLVGIDGWTNALWQIDPVTAAASKISDLPDVGDTGGMAVLGSTAYFGLGYNGTNRLYSVDLFTGIYDEIGAFDFTRMSGLAIQDTSIVPLPPALWLLGSGIIGLIGIARRKKS